jgi:membrane-associated protein
MRNGVLSAIFAIGIDPEKLLQTVGLIGLFAIVFAESGIMIGFFLPGDSLLFAAGLFTYRGELAGGHIWIVSLGCAIAAVAGDQVGYAFGKRVGPTLFRREKSRFFKPEYVDAAERFFEHYGAKAIVLARFVPVVRTFCPIVAGVSKMHYRTFVRFNVIGGVVWAVGFTQLGYWLGRAFPGIGDNLEIAIVVIVLFSLVPIGIEIWRHRRKAKAAALAEVGEPDGA